jgi:hypothetical protein
MFCKWRCFSISRVQPNVKEVRHQVGERLYDGSTFSCEDRNRVLDKLAAIQELYLPPHQI